MVSELGNWLFRDVDPICTRQLISLYTTDKFVFNHKILLNEKALYFY